jgi:protein gp37
MNKQFKSGSGSRGIEWTDLTYNVSGGCFHGCKWRVAGKETECYAKTVAEAVARAAYPEGFEHHYWHEGRVGELRAYTTPSLVFIDSMSDLFGHWVPDEQVRTILEEVRSAPQHIGQVLTKNAPRILQFLDVLPDNLWVGVSSPPDAMWGHDLSRLQQRKMLEVQLKTLEAICQTRPDLITWMSIEPLSWDISALLTPASPLRWAVIGAATHGRKAYQPDPDDVRRVLAVLDANEVPVFFKGNLEWNPWREDFPPISHPALARRRRMALRHGWTVSRFDAALDGGPDGN